MINLEYMVSLSMFMMVFYFVLFAVVIYLVAKAFSLANERNALLKEIAEELRRR
ncbi:hypothetical protein SAMN04487975_105155 [Planococcus glaciei]|uniref:hypothetical protein n=1 Tax=Planococcus glaciei TaxID=459472 RepID=UPI0008849F87|nr:hypothetical protein [Planococcus glaciei]SDH53324.1 hypothetical protein SAMN04487975_105155 [Planococcus glaciei]